MKWSQDWYGFGWKMGAASNADAPRPLNRPTSKLSSETGWYEFGWRAGMAADLSAARSPGTSGSWKARLNNGWNALTQVLSFALKESPEPRIWAVDSSNRLFNAYDPRTGRTLHSATEYEVRVWLEDRYNL